MKSIAALFLFLILYFSTSYAINSAIEDPLAQEEDCIEELATQNFEGLKNRFVKHIYSSI